MDFLVYFRCSYYIFLIQHTYDESIFLFSEYKYFFIDLQLGTDTGEKREGMEGYARNVNYRSSVCVLVYVRERERADVIAERH